MRAESWRRLGRLLATAGIIAGGPTIVRAQVDLIPPEILAKLVPATERPLALASDGEALRFRTGTERWEEAMPPGIVDLDRDGTKDYIVLILADGESGRRALLARVWGDTADAFGPTVFYVIIEDNDDVAEWAGSPRLAARPAEAVTGVPAGVGVAADIGLRASMEDRWAVQVTPVGLFAAVYDGHGGAHIAERAAAELHLAVLRAVQAGLDPDGALRRAFAELEAMTVDPDCGSTVAALLLTGATLTTAHVGDSRVVRIGRAGVEGLTRDHRIDAADERARVLRMGARLDPPYVVRGDRGLMMTRSLGDRWFRPVGVIAEPEVGCHALAPDDVALVAATDGVWDVLSVEDAARIVRLAATAHDAAEALVDDALEAGTHDNVTAVVVRLGDLAPVSSRRRP